MLHSDWLLRMIRKSGAQPRQRLLALFDILDDWVDAPHIRASIRHDGLGEPTEQQLLELLAEEARRAGVAAPAELASQLHLIALGALHQELLHPGSDALRQARAAAVTLIDQQRAPCDSTLRGSGAALALAGMALATWLLWPAGHLPAPAQTLPPPAVQAVAFEAPRPPAVSPDQVAALYYSIEQLRHGVCQYPQALMLPESQRQMFLDNIVGGNISTRPEHMPELKRLLQKVDCYYPSQLNSSMHGGRQQPPLPVSSLNRGI